jgi:hypothetical protein
MTTDNPLPTPPSASASATPAPAPTATAAASASASASQTTDPVAAAAAPAAAGQPTPAAQQQQQQQQPSPAEAIETLLQQIVASNNEAELATTLLNSLGTPETRESILASVTPSGADPLDALDAARHTIGVLFILCVVVSLLLSSPLSPPPPGIASLYIEMRVCAEQRYPFFHRCVYCLFLFYLYLSIVWSKIFNLLGLLGASLFP